MPKKPGEPPGNDGGVALLILRTIRGQTQEELGRRSGVRSPSISGYESGKVAPELRTLKELLRALDFPLSALEETERFVRRMRSRSLPAEGMDGFRSEEISSEVGRVAEAFARTLLDLARGESTGTPQAPEVPPVPSDDEARAADLWRDLKSLSPKARAARVDADPGLRNPALVRLLAKESIAAAGADPRKAVALAELAVSIARQVKGPLPLSSRLVGYALAYLANAEHAAGDLAAAERTFAESDELWRPWQAEYPDSLDDATVWVLKASLRRTQARFDEAITLHDQALESRGADAMLPQLLASKAYTLDQAGDLAGMVATLEEADGVLKGTEEPRIVLSLRHNLADALSKAGRFAEAKALLPGVKRLAAKAGSELDFARVQWVEGRVEAGLGNREEGAELLQRARGVFMSKGLGLDAALVTLELSFLYIEGGRMGSVKDLARNLASLFRAQALPRETLAALQLFRQAAEAEAVTADLVERLTGYLRRSRYDPGLKFEDKGF
jgi:transcriptional regulator with XRE-family HTH domain